MRGLTPEEYAVLRDLARCGPEEPCKSWAEWDLLVAFAEQGRSQLDYTGGIPGYVISAAGRDALRLYPLMLALASACAERP